MEASPLRMVLLGKTGAGKSSFANTLQGSQVFQVNHTAISGTGKCKAATGVCGGVPVCVVDTPGLFDVSKPEAELRPDITRSIVECSPGPHAFLIVLKLEVFTVHEKEIINKILQTFSEEALKYAVLVFTHGDQLPDNTTIEDFIKGNQDLAKFYDKCGGRCHVFDNKYWTNTRDPYRNNQVQLGKLLKTIKKMVARNGGGCYTNEMLQEVERIISREEERIRHSKADVSPQARRQQAQDSTFQYILRVTVGITTGVLLGSLLGATLLTATLVKSRLIGDIRATAIVGGLVGGALGGYYGAQEGSQADTVGEAVVNTAGAVWNSVEVPMRGILGIMQPDHQGKQEQ